MKAQVFFRIDHPSLKTLVDKLESEVGDSELTAIECEAVKLDVESGNLNFGIGYDMCIKGSPIFYKLSRDKRYAERTYDPSKGKSS